MVTLNNTVLLVTDYETIIASSVYEESPRLALVHNQFRFIFRVWRSIFPSQGQNRSMISA